MSGSMLSAILLLLGIAVVSTVLVFLAPILLLFGAAAAPPLLTWWAVWLSRKAELNTLQRRTENAAAEALRNSHINRHYAEHYAARVQSLLAAEIKAKAAGNSAEAARLWAEYEQCSGLRQRYSDWATYYIYQYRDAVNAKIEIMERRAG